MATVIVHSDDNVTMSCVEEGNRIPLLEGNGQALIIIIINIIIMSGGLMFCSCYFLFLIIAPVIRQPVDGSQLGLLR